ncbi:MAG: peptide chain release factor 1 [Spirochaetes bacterium]|nr:peptide chain release factor 1 [Spirochaetota bacterium]
MINPTKIKEKENRLAEIDKILLDKNLIKDNKKYGQILKERSGIEELLSLYKRYTEIEKEKQEAQALLEDEEMGDMAASEMEKLRKEFETVEKKIRSRLVKKDPQDEKNAFLEIRAGTGGEESAIFAGDLFRMYQKYCEKKKWKMEIMSSHASDLNGFKEIIVYVKGKDVYFHLKFESGVHRVQRIPVTESGGRIHTSAVSVAVLPQIEEEEVDIDPKDLKIDVFRASGAGGQHVNTTDSAVRITHAPTGIVVSCQDERSQHQNKAKAMQILRARLYEKQQKDIQDKIDSQRKSMIGSGDRSEKIRTYNYPQNRVTDHRINLTLYKLDKIMDGDIDDIVNSLITFHEKEKVDAA